MAGGWLVDRASQRITAGDRVRNLVERVHTMRRIEVSPGLASPDSDSRTRLLSSVVGRSHKHPRRCRTRIDSASDGNHTGDGEEKRE